MKFKSIYTSLTESIRSKIYPKTINRTKRVLKITGPGLWYLGFTILLGVTAIASANNIIYLFESFILGGLILSGVLSEWAISGLEIQWKRGRATAGKTPRDTLWVTNCRKFPIYCIEIGEWSNARFLKRTYIPILMPGESKRISVTDPYLDRGRFKWDGLAVSTSYPFGFAQKLLLHPLPGNRIVWPKAEHHQDPNKNRSHSTQNHTNTNSLSHANLNHGTDEYLDGEARPAEIGEDLRDLAWTLTLSQGRPFKRKRTAASSGLEMSLDLRQSQGVEFERQIQSLAQLVYRKHKESNSKSTQDIRLKLIDHQSVTTVLGAEEVLDSLALAQAKGFADGSVKKVS